MYGMRGLIGQPRLECRLEWREKRLHLAIVWEMTRLPRLLGLLLAEKPTSEKLNSGENPEPLLRFFMKKTGIRTENITIDCPYYTLNEVVRVTWIRKRRELVDQPGKISVTLSRSLRIFNLTQKDRGIYACTVHVKDGRPIRSKVKLLIQEKPTLLVRPAETKTVTEGHPVALHCPNHGRPVPRVTWFKDGVKLKQRALNSRFMHFPDGKVFILDARVEDAGSYKCVVRNRHGQIEATTNLTVCDNKPPAITYLTPTVFNPSKEQHPVQLTCVAEGRSPMAIHWYFDTKRIAHRTSFRSHLLPNGMTKITSQLLLVRFNQKQCYEVFCKAKNGQGSVTKSTSVCSV
eukprot:m.21722 g.21722  ORF g.21722 m.21722 type:complete len:346 (+) comp28207_c0_seq2:1384-2421(+)